MFLYFVFLFLNGTLVWLELVVFLYFVFDTYFCIFVLELNPCMAGACRAPADNYNHLSVPDPATACGNLLYRARPGEKGSGVKGWMVEESLSDSCRLFV